MLKIKLHVRSNCTMSIKKSEHGFIGQLKIGDTIIHTADDSAFSISLGAYEGQKLNVYVEKKNIFYEGRCIAELDSLFDNGVTAKLVYRPSEGRAIVCIPIEKGKSRAISQWIDLDNLPTGLFDHRLWFPVIVHDDSHLTIVRYANLHQHTDASLLDGMVKVEDLAKKTEWASAVTDHGNMHAFNSFYKSMKKEGKHPIIGCEVYVETPGSRARQVLNLSDDDQSDARMFDNERAPKSTLAGEHMILLAENEEGLHNLFHLVTESSKHFYRHPHVTWEMLEKYHGGLIATSACIAGCLGRSIKEIIKCEMHPDAENAEEVKEDNERILALYFQKMLAIFGKDNFFVELQDHHFPLEKAIMARAKEYSEKYGVSRTVGIDAHYLNKEDAEVHEMWLCQQTKKKMTEPDRMRFSGDGYYVHTSDEVVDLFPNDLDALDNTLTIAERCRIDLKEDGYHLPHFPLPDGYEDDSSYLRHLVETGFETLWDRHDLGTDHTEEERQKYIDRIEEELSVIGRMGWESYFLVVSDFIAYAKDTDVKSHIERYFPSKYYDHSSLPDSVFKTHEIYTGSGRGSAAGSLVCACLGITKVDPIKYDLLFERFLSPDRVSMPDIDTDFEDSTREEVIEYCRVKYGEDHVSRIVTFGTAAAKNSLKIVARVCDRPVALGNELADAVPNEPKMTLAKAEQESPDFRALEADAEKKALIDSAKKIECLITNRSIHACGVLISDRPVVEYMPQILMKNPHGDEQIWTTELQGPECEDMGLLKMDFLGLITLGIAHETIDLIKKNHGEDIIYDEIPLDDVSVYQFLAHGNTVAVFQAESEIFTKTLTGVLSDVDDLAEGVRTLSDSVARREAEHRLGEKMFLRVSDCNALVRPGPNQYVNEYIENISKNPKEIHYDDESMREQLESTGGIMLYQEQVMLLTRKMAGFSAGQADTIRKAMGKKKRAILDEFAEYFVTGSIEKNIKGCVANGIPEDVARKVWSDMEKFAGYAFNKSHAVAYSMHTVRTAWLAKYYYPEYMTAVLNANLKNTDKIRGYIPVCRQQGTSILPPSINESMAGFSTNGTEIRFGLGGLKGLGSSSSLIIKEREEHGKFSSYEEFVYRMARYQRFTKTILESLIKAGCLDGFDGSSRASKLSGVDETLKFASLARTISKENYSIFDMFDEFTEHKVPAWELMNLQYDKDIPEMSQKELLANENDIVGFYMCGHPMDEYDKVLQESSSVTSVFNIYELFDSSDDRSTLKASVTIAGIIKDVVKKIDRNGNPWWVMTVEDKTGIMKCTHFNNKHSHVGDLIDILKKEKLVELQGVVTDDGYGPEMRVEYVAPLTKFLDLTQARKITLTLHEWRQKYQRINFGRQLEEPSIDFIKNVLNCDGIRPNEKGGAEIILVVNDKKTGAILKEENIGQIKLNLQQYVELQRCLGSSNVQPVLQIK